MPEQMVLARRAASLSRDACSPTHAYGLALGVMIESVQVAETSAAVWHVAEVVAIAILNAAELFEPTMLAQHLALATVLLDGGSAQAANDAAERLADELRPHIDHRGPMS
jgi:hypothetical protein